jgi:hypothetical protein
VSIVPVDYYFVSLDRNNSHITVFFSNSCLSNKSDYGDVHIGYRFANILYRDDDQTLGVDLELINDIREQLGGGAEPLETDVDD